MLSAGSLSLFSIFILILVYWADILKKYVQERSEWRQVETRDASRSSRDEPFKTREQRPITRYERPKRATSGSKRATNDAFWRSSLAKSTLRTSHFAR